MTYPGYQQKSLENQEILIRENREVKSLLLQVLSQSRERHPTGSGGCFQLIPLRILDDLRQLNEFLEVPDNFIALVG